MIQKNTVDCGCEITVYGDGSAPPKITFCDLHDAALEMRDVVWEVLGEEKISDALRQRARTVLRKLYGVKGKLNA